MQLLQSPADVSSPSSFVLHCRAVALHPVVEHGRWLLISEESSHGSVGCTVSWRRAAVENLTWLLSVPSDSPLEIARSPNVAHASLPSPSQRAEQAGWKPAPRVPSVQKAKSLLTTFWGQGHADHFDSWDSNWSPLAPPFPSRMSPNQRSALSRYLDARWKQRRQWEIATTGRGRVSWKGRTSGSHPRTIWRWRCEANPKIRRSQRVDLFVDPER